MKKQQSGRANSPLFLGIIAALILSCTGLLLNQFHQKQLASMRHKAAETRAEVIANTMSEKFTHALNLGIPLHALTGVPELLALWRQTHRDIQFITLVDVNNHALWSIGEQTANSLAHSQAAIRSSHDREHAQLHIYVAPYAATQPWEILSKLLSPAVLVLSFLSFLAARFSYAQGPWLRLQAMQWLTTQIATGNFSQITRLPRQPAFEQDSERLSIGIRTTHESMERLRRLVTSLRQTEPSPHHRDRLDSILEQSNRGLNFSENLHTTSVVAVHAQAFWMALLLSLAGISSLWPLQHAGYSLFTSLNITWALYCFSLYAGAKLTVHLRYNALAILSTAYVLLLLIAGISPITTSFWIALQITAAGFSTGMGLTACHSAIHQTKRHQRYLETRPRYIAAATQAWWLSALWIAPLLSVLTLIALPSELIKFALLLPALGGLLWVFRWNTALSPWHTRTNIQPSKPLPKHTKQAWLWCFSCSMLIAALFPQNSSTLITACSSIATGWIAGHYIFRYQKIGRHFQFLLAPCATILVFAANVNADTDSHTLLLGLGLGIWSSSWAAIFFKLIARTSWCAVIGGGLTVAGLSALGLQSYVLALSTLPWLLACTLKATPPRETHAS